MPKLKLTQISEKEKVSIEELKAVSEPAGRKKSSGQFDPLLSKQAKYLLGMPVFDAFPFKEGTPVVIPVAQRHLAREVLKKTQDKKSMISRLKSEYKSIVKTLQEMKIGFRILNMEKGDAGVRRWLSKEGCEGLILDVDHPDRWQIFPRDMFVYIEHANTLLVHSKLFKIKKDRKRKSDVIHTTWAEGGKMLCNGHHIIVGRHPEMIRQKGRFKVFRFLEEKGINIVTLPQAIFCHLSRKGNGKNMSLYYDSHLDRSASLFKGKDNAYHLLVDPGYRTGPLIDPLSVDKSIGVVRKVCEENEIHVHIPKSVSVPYATSTVQFDNGKVLAVGGDDEILATIASIVGDENLHVTDVSISLYPVFACAGLHCLITETPKPLIAV